MSLQISPQLRTVPRAQVAVLTLAVLAAGFAIVSPSLPNIFGASGSSAETRAVEGYGDLPISFEPNVGQAPNRFDYVARGQGFGMAINATGATLSLGSMKAQELVRLDLVGANRSATSEGLESLPGKTNYFIGDNPSKWRSEVPTFGRISYSDVLPGIDVTYYGTKAGALEYDFVVAPGADPRDIRVAFSGAKDVTLQDGSIVITTKHGEATQAAPVLYQTIDGRRIPVSGGFSLSGNKVGFDVGAYDDRYPLVIDPTLVYSTFLGGTGDEFGYGITVDGSGSAYVTGATNSMTTFPLQDPVYPLAAGYDAFVTKFDPTGSTLIYSTYLGGHGVDRGHGITLDATGAVYVTGSTASFSFPTQAPFQAANGGGDSDAFVTKLNPAGSAFSFSTYLGGAGAEIGYAIDVDGSNAAYVSGTTTSQNFPTVTPFQAFNGGGVGGGNDAFVTKFTAAGSALTYSTYLGGMGSDLGRGIAVDSSGVAYLAGETSSTDFPTQAPLQGANAGSTDAFVTQLTTAGSALTYSTYLGGTGSDLARGIAVDSSGAAYLTGETSSTDFPTQVPLQAANAGGIDAFVTKLNSSGSALTYSTYHGGTGNDLGSGIAIDGSGSAYVIGSTFSSNFPTVDPLQASNAGADDAFISQLTATGSALALSTYFGGSFQDFGHGIAIDGSGSIYVTGSTFSSNFPMQAPFQNAISGIQDAFVAKLSPSLASPSPSPTATPSASPSATPSVSPSPSPSASASASPSPTPSDTPSPSPSPSPSPVEDKCGGEDVTIYVAAPGLTTYGTPEVDVIIGTSGDDIIYGLDLADIICGMGGDDMLYGGGGNDGGKYGDSLYGQGGNDRLAGDGGNDPLRGGPGNDRIFGNVGNDLLFGNGGKDRIDGNEGDDRINGGSQRDVCNGGPGRKDKAKSCERTKNIPRPLA